MSLDRESVGPVSGIGPDLIAHAAAALESLDRTVTVALIEHMAEALPDQRWLEHHMRWLTIQGDTSKEDATEKVPEFVSTIDQGYYIVYESGGRMEVQHQKGILFPRYPGALRPSDITKPSWFYYDDLREQWVEVYLKTDRRYRNGVGVRERDVSPANLAATLAGRGPRELANVAVSAYFFGPYGPGADPVRAQRIISHRKPAKQRHEPLPADYEVQPLRRGQIALERATCGHCGLSWDDGVPTSMTPAPSGRCPFEAFHVYPDE